MTESAHSEAGKKAAQPNPLAIRDPWFGLRKFTPARIALGRVGDSLPTSAMLDFTLAHARARDAVHAIWNREALYAALGEATEGFGLPRVCIQSAASDRAAYLRNPGLGRSLPDSQKSLLLNRHTEGAKPDVVFVIADGLSAKAAERHAAALLGYLLPMLAGLAHGSLGGGRASPGCLERCGWRIAWRDHGGDAHWRKARIERAG